MSLPCRAPAGVLAVAFWAASTLLANCTYDLFTACGSDRIAGGHHRADASAGYHRSGPAPGLPDSVLCLESCAGMDPGALCDRFRRGTSADLVDSTGAGVAGVLAQRPVSRDRPGAPGQRRRTVAARHAIRGRGVD